MAGIETITSLMGALGIGSVLGQYLSSTKERRSSRAGALQALGAVESARWAGYWLSVDGWEGNPDPEMRA